MKLIRKSKWYFRQSERMKQIRRMIEFAFWKERDADVVMFKEALTREFEMGKSRYISVPEVEREFYARIRQDVEAMAMEDSEKLFSEACVNMELETGLSLLTTLAYTQCMLNAPEWERYKKLFPYIQRFAYIWLKLSELEKKK